MFYINLNKLSLVVVTLLFLSDRAYGEEVDILDQLEKRLSEKEFNYLTPMESEVFEKKNNKGDASEIDIRLDDMTVNAMPPEHKRLLELTKEIDLVSAKIDELKADVSSLTMTLEEEKKIKGFLNLTVKVLGDSNNIVIYDVDILVNDRNIYDLSKYQTTILPTTKMQVFQGPIKYGKHQLKVGLVLKLSSGAEHAFKAIDTKIIKKEFDIDYQEGAGPINYDIVVKKEEESQKLTAELIEAG